MNDTRIRHFKRVLTVVLMGLSAACTSLRPVAVEPTGERVRAEVKVGDTVRAVTTDGVTVKFEVTAVGMASLIGDSSKVWGGGTNNASSRMDLPYRDIRQLEVQFVSVPKTVGIIAAVALVGAVGVATGGGSHSPGYSR